MPSSLDVTTRPAVRADIPAMAAVLGRAFLENDPVGAYLFPDTRIRGNRQVRMMSVLIRHRFIPQHGAEVAEVDGTIVGVCLWRGYPERRTPWHTFVSGPKLLWAMRSRVFAGISLDATFAKITPALPHLFWVYLGCEPHLQKQGVGEALVRSFLGKADETSLPVIGVCKDENVPYYRMFGFGLLGTATIGRNGSEENVLIKLPATETTENERTRTAV